MPILSHPAFGPRTAIIYVTVGLLTDVWTGVWFFAFGRPAGQSVDNTTCFWLAGFFLTGISLIGIGLFLGPLGRAARAAELPPVGAMGMEAAIQQTAAGTPNPVVVTPPGISPNAMQPALVANVAAVPASARQAVISG